MRVKKYLLVLASLMLLSLFVTACDSNPDAPKNPINVTADWNPTAPNNNRTATAVMFKHDDHNDLDCNRCHANGNNKFPLTGDINGLSTATNAGHKFCVDSCHLQRNIDKGKQDTPTIIQGQCQKCHTGGATFNGGNVNLQKNWFNGVGGEKPVLLSHDSHKNHNASCTDCHATTPLSIETGKIAGKNTKDLAHDVCVKCHYEGATNTGQIRQDCTFCHK